MKMREWVAMARARGASDLHLEAGLPPVLRVRGKLEPSGPPVSAEHLSEEVKQLLGERVWRDFQERSSADLSRTLGAVRCRINVLRTARGVGVALRLFPSVQPTLQKLNLHPDLGRLTQIERGLVLICGPTGCGKSSTMAALLHSISGDRARHILTIESPIEYVFKSGKSLVRQRQVGRDTPSFSRGLLDALREDPDVIMVGEMRAARTMRLTLNAAESGHLLLSTLHSSNCAEALQRITAAFHPQIQPAVQAELADTLQAVVCQRLRFRPELGLRIPECEILIANRAVRNLIRSGELFKLGAVLQTGASEGMWTFERYREWIHSKAEWSLPEEIDAHDSGAGQELEPDESSTRSASPNGLFEAAPEAESPAEERRGAGAAQPDAEEEDVIVLQPSDESIADILSELDEPERP